MKQIILIIFITSPFINFAQKKSAIQFTNITEAGFLLGKSENTLNIQTINGITFKGKNSIGIGIGLDNYGYKSVPLFIDVRKKIGNAKCKLLLYADGGLNIPIRNNNTLPEKWDDGTAAYDLHSKFYGEAGFGINNKISKKLSFNLTVGYSYKHFSYTEHGRLWYILPYYFSSENATYNYYYRRTSIRFGLQF